MDAELVLRMVKFNLGLSTDVRDEYLKSIIKSAAAEMKNSGIDPVNQSQDYQDEYWGYLADYSAWLYRNRGGEQDLPRFLKFRRHNLIVGKEDV